MSTDEEGAKAPITTPTSPYKLTRGGAYLIEGLLEHHTAFTPTEAATRRAARLRRKIEAQNPAVLDDGFKIGKQLIRKASESDIEWANRQIEVDSKISAWQDEEVVLELTTKERDFLVSKALKWAFGNREKVFTQNNDHILSIIDAFDLVDDGE